MKQINRFLELDALRGIAAIIIVLFHFTMHKNISHYFNFGCIGVDVFFILSGFVIYMYIDKSKSLQIFLLNRFSRLYPTYWFCLCITTIFVLFHIQSIYFANHSFEWTNNLLVKYLINATMFQYFFSITNMDGSYWTLTIELIFYGLIGLGIYTKQLKHIEFSGFIIAILCSIYAFDSIATHWFFHKLLIAVPIIGYFNLFYAGIVFYRMKTTKPTLVKFIILLMTYIIQCSLFKNCYYNSTFLNANEYYTLLACVYLIYTLFIFDKLKFLIQPVFLWFGKISYPLYLMHNFIGIYILIPAFSAVTHSLFLSIILSFLTIVFVSFLINKYIEMPSMKYLKARFRAK